MTDDLTAAIERLEAGLARVAYATLTAEEEADLRTVIAAAKQLPQQIKDKLEARKVAQSFADDLAAAKRPPLTDATVEQLARLIRGYWDEEVTAPSDRPDLELAAVILAEYRVGVTTRERLAEHFAAKRYGIETREVDPEVWALFIAHDRQADELLASGAVEDRAEVEATTLEAAVAEVRAWGFTAAARLEARAASIREGNRG